MAANAGEGTGEMPGQFSSAAVEQSLTEALGSGGGQIAFEHSGEPAELVLPKRLLVQVLANLVRNAVDAQREAGTSEPIRVVSRVADGRAAFEILDHGAGIPDHARARIGEPFFTTKAPGRGLGLGVFLARAFAEKVGGELTLSARPSGGTLARLSVPVDMLEARSGA
jgi:two-component system, sensor histidine kinase RegB